MNILSRIFEPFPVNWRRMFHEGDTVVLMRPLFFWQHIPVYTMGRITYIAPLELETNDPIEVEFDLFAYQIPLEDSLILMLEKAGITDIPAFYEKSVLRVTPNDIEVLPNAS